MRKRTAERILEAEKDSGFETVEAAARAVGVSLRLYQKWRAGDVSPSYVNLKRLERAFGKPALWFYGEAEAAA